MRRRILLATAAWALLAQDPPPTPAEVAKAYESKVSEHGARLLFWEKRFATFTVRDIRGWEIRFRNVKQDASAPVFKQHYQALAKKAGVCHKYAVTQVSPVGPPPQYVKRDVRVEDLGVVACR